MDQLKQTRIVTVDNRAGLHARAAYLINKLAREYPDADVALVKDSQLAPASNMIDMLSLGAKPGDKLVLEASGPRRRRPWTPWNDCSPRSSTKQTKTPRPRMSRRRQPPRRQQRGGRPPSTRWVSMHKLQGIAVSPGVAIGEALVMDNEGFRIPRRFVTRDAVDDELDRLNKAMAAAGKEIAHHRDTVPEELGEKYGAIFEAHLQMLQDCAAPRATWRR